MARRAKAGAKFAEVCLGDRDRAALEDYSHRLGIKPPQLRESGEVSSPMIVGGRAPFLLLPKGFARHTENEIRAALCHELAHIQRRDYLLNAACQVAALPLVWHPVVDWVQQRIHMTREMVCDAMAAQEMKSQLGYAKCLLALAHSMLGGRGMAAQGQFLGLFGNHTLEERVMRLMDTTTLSVRAKAARVVSGAVMTIATGVIAGMFHVTPTMAQANVVPQAMQNPPAEAQAPVPEPNPGSPSAIHLATRRPPLGKNTSTSIAVEAMGKATNLPGRSSRSSTRTSSSGWTIYADKWQRTRPRLTVPSSSKRMEDAQRQMAQAAAKFNSPELQQRMEDLARQMAEEMAKVNSAEFKQRMEDAQRANGAGSGEV